MGPWDPPAGLLHTCKRGLNSQDQDEDTHLRREETASGRLRREGEAEAWALAGLGAREVVSVDVDVWQEL